MQQLNLEKEYRFFILKKFTETIKDSSLEFAAPESKKVHQIIRSIIKDYHFYTNYMRQQLNLIEGERVLKINGMKIIYENNNYFMQKYLNVLSITSNKEESQNNKISFYRSQCLTNPTPFLLALGYACNQSKFFKYDKLQVYKCPSYGIQIILYERKKDQQFLQIASVSQKSYKNVISEILIEKLKNYVTQSNQIDSYTLKPKSLRLSYEEPHH